MAITTRELVWIKQLFKELKFCDIQQMKLICDNQATIHVDSKPMFHEMAKHIEIDSHFVQEKVLSKEVLTELVS